MGWTRALLAAARCGFAAGALGLAVLPAAAQGTWPTQPLKLVVPFAAGGATDAAARALATDMGKLLGQQVIVENKPGAAGMLAAESVAKAAANGYTLCFCSTGPMTIAPYMASGAKPAYDPLKDLVPVSLVMTYENVLIARKGLPANNFKELVALAKSKPGALTYATVGIGSTNHLFAEVMQREVGISMLHVPYKGESLAVTDVMGEQVDLLFAGPMMATPLIRDGKIKAIAVLDHGRSRQLLPEVGTIIEAGYPNVAMTNFAGVAVPTGTPQAIVDQLARATATVMHSPAVQTRFREMALNPVGSTPAEFTAAIARDTALWGGVLKQLKLARD